MILSASWKWFWTIFCVWVLFEILRIKRLKGALVSLVVLIIAISFCGCMQWSTQKSQRSYACVDENWLKAPAKQSLGQSETEKFSRIFTFKASLNLSSCWHTYAWSFFKQLFASYSNIFVKNCHTNSKTLRTPIFLTQFADLLYGGMVRLLGPMWVFKKNSRKQTKCSWKICFRAKNIFNCDS